MRMTEYRNCDCGCGRRWVDVFRQEIDRLIYLKSIKVNDTDKQCIYLGPLSGKTLAQI